MAKFRRLKIEDPLARLPGLEPAARVVDTFVEPVPLRENSLSLQLAKAVGVISDLGLAQKEIIDEDAKRRAKVEFEKERIPYDKAVKKGIIKTGENPFFIREWKLQELRLKAATMDQFLRNEYATSEDIRSTTDPAALEAWYASARAQWIEDNGGLDQFDVVELTDSFFPAAEAYANQLFQVHRERRSAAIENEVEENSKLEISNMIDGAVDAGTEIDGLELGFQIALINEPMVSSSRNPTAAGRSTVDAVVEKYKETGDDNLVEALDHIPAGPGSFLGGTTYAKEQIRQARDYLENQYQSRARFAEWRRDQQKEIRTQQIVSEALPEIMRNPGHHNFAVWFDALNAVDPAAAQNLASFRERRLNADYTVREDRATVADLYQGLRTGRYGTNTVIAYAARGLINDPVEALRFLDRTRSFSDALDFRGYTTTKEALSRILLRQHTDKVTGNPSGYAQSISEQAALDMDLAALDWLEDNKLPSGGTDLGAFRIWANEYLREAQNDPRYIEFDQGSYVEPIDIQRPPDTSKLTPVGEEEDDNPFDQFD